MAKILLTADWHLRGDAPVCRKNPESWLSDQQASVKQLYGVVHSKGCDEVWVVGDLFHRARTSTEATVQALQLLSRFSCTVRVLPGNHDLRYHSYENLSSSTLGTVFSLKDVKELRSYEQPLSWGADAQSVLVEAYPFGTEPEKIPHCDVWCTHQLVFPDEESRPLPELGVLAEDLLQRSDAKVIVTGDYHHGYIKEFGDRKVITCGCLNIQARDMADYKPRVYILDLETLDVETVFLDTFGELDLDTPMLEDANGYAETLQVVQLPKLDFRDAVDKAAEKAESDVRDKVNSILEDYDATKIA